MEKGVNETELSCHERSGVRVHHHGFGIVIGERIIKPRLADRFVCWWRTGWHHTYALLPQSEMAENALDDIAVIDKSNNTHFLLAFWIGGGVVRP